MKRAHHAMKRPFGKARASELCSGDRSMPFALLLLATAVLFHFSVEVGVGDSVLGFRLSSFR